MALALAPNGQLVLANGDAVNPNPGQPREIVEFTTLGEFVSQLSVDKVQGSAFGLAIAAVNNDTIRLAAVDDSTNTLSVWTLRIG